MDSGVEIFIKAINSAENLRRAGRAQNAIEILTTLLKTPEFIDFCSDANTKSLDSMPARLLSASLFNLAKSYSDLGENKRAISAYNTLLKTFPNDYEARFNLGNLYIESAPKIALQIYELARESVENEIYMRSWRSSFEPDMGVGLDKFLNCELLPQMALACVRIDDLSSAVDLYSQIFRYNQEDPDFCFNYAYTMGLVGEFAQARSFYERALNLLALKNPAQSRSYSLNLAHLLLRNGELKEGFAHYENRLFFIESDLLAPLLERYESFAKSLPNGTLSIAGLNSTFFGNYANNAVLSHSISDLAQSSEQNLSQIAAPKILIFSEQGLGDAIMFVRFLPYFVNAVRNGLLGDLIPKESEILFLVQPVLLRLFETLAKKLEIKIIQSVGSTELAGFCAVLPLGSLPYILSADEIPSHRIFSDILFKSYEKCDISSNEIKNAQKAEKQAQKTRKTNIQKSLTQKIESAKARHAKTRKFRVGFAFKSISKAKDAQSKSIPLNEFIEGLKPALRGSCELVCMQPDCTKNEAEILKKEGIECVGAKFKDLQDAKNALESVDCVVCVDSAFAHLALSCEVACAVLLQRRYDWRWGKFGIDFVESLQPHSPWYPQAVLFTQSRLDSWSGTLARACEFVVVMKNQVSGVLGAF